MRVVALLLTTVPLVSLLPVKPSLLGTAAIHIDNRPESMRRKEAGRRWVRSAMHRHKRDGKKTEGGREKIRRREREAQERKFLLLRYATGGVGKGGAAKSNARDKEKKGWDHEIIRRRREGRARAKRNKR